MAECSNALQLISIIMIRKDIFLKKEIYVFPKTLIKQCLNADEIK